MHLCWSGTSLFKILDQPLLYIELGQYFIVWRCVCVIFSLYISCSVHYIETLVLYIYMLVCFYVCLYVYMTNLLWWMLAVSLCVCFVCTHVTGCSLMLLGCYGDVLRVKILYNRKTWHLFSLQNHFKHELVCIV